MTNLPLSISNAPAKSAAGKPSSNDDVARQDAQGFGNMLARQLADAARPDESAKPSSGDAVEQDKTDTAAAADSAKSLPADLMAALLAQQNPAATPAQPDASQQSLLNTQIAATSSGTAELNAIIPGEAHATASASPALISGNVSTGNTAAAVLDTASPKDESAAKDSKSFAATFNGSIGLSDAVKELATKESSSPASSLSLRGGAMSELSTSAQQPLFSAPLPNISAPTNPLSIATAVTQPAWGEEFSQQITWIATQRNQSAELHLNPPQLGPLDVVLKISGDQASVIFTSPHAAVRDAIEQALPKLREMLADSGIMLGNATVSDQAGKNSQDSASRKPQEGTRSSLADSATESARIHETQVSSISRHNGMVDTFA